MFFKNKQTKLEQQVEMLHYQFEYKHHMLVKKYYAQNNPAFVNLYESFKKLWEELFKQLDREAYSFLWVELQNKLLTNQLGGILYENVLNPLLQFQHHILCEMHKQHDSSYFENQLLHVQHLFTQQLYKHLLYINK